MLIAGSDVSGDVNKGQHRHIAFVVGKEESINALHNEIGIKEIHMLRLEEREKRHVIQTIDFQKYNIKAWCFYVNKQNAINSIYSHTKLRPKNRMKEKVYETFDFHLLDHFKSELEDLTFANSIRLTDLHVQCEGDMSYTVINWKMTPDHKGKAYEFSDAVAWCNERGKKLKGCIECNLEEILYNKTSFDLFK
jgi:hypothetical protein